MHEQANLQPEAPPSITLPAPTAWPLVLAFGVTLVFAGMVTTMAVSILGAVLSLAAYAGWFRDVLPHERHVSVPDLGEPEPVATRHPSVARVNWITHDQHRARLPLETYPISAGVKGGLAGSVAMAVLAMACGLIVHQSVWYPVNLLAADFFPAEALTTADLGVFQPALLAVAGTVHIVTSLLVGLLYGALLPMCPRHPILLSGVVAPILWSGLIHSVVVFLAPVVGDRIDWPWFVVTQVGFGIVAGVVVSRQQRRHTWQHLPFAVRAGIEAPGAMDQTNGEGPRP